MAEQIFFDRSLYLPDAVEAAAAAYAEHARIAVTPIENGLTAVISDVVEHDERTVVNAFCNHVLHETIARIRQSALQEVG